MAGVYRPRHPERTILYRVLFHHFDRFLTEYEARFEREYGFSFLEPEGKIGYRWGRGGAEQERMDYLEFIARATSHIPDKGQVMVRYYGLYANAHRGKVKRRA
jgi:Putative transposase